MTKTILIKHKLLLMEAHRWLGVTERGGNNSGQIVEMFQKTIGTAEKEPWCMGLVQTCLMWAENYFDAAFMDLQDADPLLIFKSEHCLTVWNKTPQNCRAKIPVPGSIVIWRHGETEQGHTGIVVEVDEKNRKMVTIEGNTGSEDDVVVREGDGVYKRRRSLIANGDMKVVGFINAWGFGSAVEVKLT